MTRGAHPQGRLNRGMRGRDARPGMRGQGAEQRAGSIPIAFGRGCSLPLRELGFGRGRRGEAKWGRREGHRR